MFTIYCLFHGLVGNSGWHAVLFYSFTVINFSKADSIFQFSQCCPHLSDILLYFAYTSFNSAFMYITYLLYSYCCASKYVCSTWVVLVRHNTSSLQGPPNMAAANFVVIWKTGVKGHADEYTYVKIKTGNRIPIWRPSVFLNLNLPPSMKGPLLVATFTVNRRYCIWNKIFIQICGMHREVLGHCRYIVCGF